MDTTRRIGLSLGADICWPRCFEDLVRRFDPCIEIDGDKVKFEVERVTIEPFDLSQHCRYDLVIARALGPMNVLLELTLPFAEPGGRLLAMKGKSAEAELRDAGDALMLLGAGDVHAYESMPEIEPEATVVEVVKEGATPDEYPRRPGEPKKSPL